MNIKVFTIIAAVLFIGACKSEDTALTQSQRDAKVDSLVGVKMEEVNRLAMEDLDRRMSIEVKVKADSIVQATLNPTTPPDNTVVGPQAQP